MHEASVSPHAAFNRTGQRQMHLLLTVGVAAFALVVSLPFSEAARDLSPDPSSAPAAELIMIEVDGCIYWEVFRRDVLPVYQASPHSRNAPIRFVDYNEPDALNVPVNGPVGIVPTFIMVKHNKEVGRIPGYIGRTEFFRAVTHMLSTP
jgi:thioredoxin-related protein